MLEELPGGGVGVAPLTPIMREVSARSPHPHALDRFYQAVAVRAPADCAIGLNRAVAAVVEHHDALRTTLRTDGLEIAAAAEPEIGVVDVDTADTATLQTHTEALVAELDPWAGEVLRVRWLRPAAGPACCCFVAHHLVIDAVSWRILVADLARRGHSATPTRISLAPVGTSMRRWAHALAAAHPQHELEHWTQVLSEHETPLGSAGTRGVRHRRNAAPGQGRDPRGHHHRAANSSSGGLPCGPRRRSAHRPRSRRRALAGPPTLLVSRESHGRDEDFVPGADLSRTVGWFTTSHPCAWRNRRRRCRRCGRAVKRVKEQLRRTPGQGTGYGVLCVETARRARRPAGRLQLPRSDRRR